MHFIYGLGTFGVQCLSSDWRKEMEKKAKLTNDRNLSLIWPHCSRLFGNVVVRKGEAEAAAVVVVSRARSFLTVCIDVHMLRLRGHCG